MSHATKHARHEQARKQHRKDAQAHARDAAKRPPQPFPMWFLTAGLGAMLLLVLAAAVVR